jgi:hypothetical protein
MAKWSDIMIYSTTKDFRPWLKNRATTTGVETLAETGFTEKFKDEMKQAGERVMGYAEGDGFFVDQEHWEDNYVYVPPIPVSYDYPFLNAIAGIFPSPDWFTGFYLFDTVDEYDRTFWERFTVRTYPWNAGTDGGQSYTAEDQDLDPPVNVERIYPNNAPSDGAFLSSDGSTVLPVAEFDCVLHVCPLTDPACLKPDWPPQNYCDILKYPGCASYCNPKKDTLCEPCKGNGYEPKTVYMKDCCAAGHLPKYSDTCEGHVNSGAGSGMRAALGLALALVGTMMFF